MPLEPAKYGIKLQCLCDVKTNCILNMEVYHGKQPDGLFELSNKSHDITIQLAMLVFDSGCNLTTDNWYKSVPLAEDLLKNKVTLIGTMRKNNHDMLPELLPKKDREVYVSKFTFQKDIMVCYIPKQKKAIILLSTMHSDISIDKLTGDKQKPSLVTFYNGTKGGTDTSDKNVLLHLAQHAQMSCHC